MKKFKEWKEEKQRKAATKEKAKLSDKIKAARESNRQCINPKDVKFEYMYNDGRLIRRETHIRVMRSLSFGEERESFTKDLRMFPFQVATVMGMGYTEEETGKILDDLDLIIDSVEKHITVDEIAKETGFSNERVIELLKVMNTYKTAIKNDKTMKAWSSDADGDEIAGTANTSKSEAKEGEEVKAEDKSDEEKAADDSVTFEDVVDEANKEAEAKADAVKQSKKKKETAKTKAAATKTEAKNATEQKEKKTNPKDDRVVPFTIDPSNIVEPDPVPAM